MSIEEDPLQYATTMAEYFTYHGNKANERGDKELAERHYDRAQKWHDKMNQLLGNGNGTDRA